MIGLASVLAACSAHEQIDTVTVSNDSKSQTSDSLLRLEPVNFQFGDAPSTFGEHFPFLSGAFGRDGSIDFFSNGRYRWRFAFGCGNAGDFELCGTWTRQQDVFTLTSDVSRQEERITKKIGSFGAVEFESVCESNSFQSISDMAKETDLGQLRLH
jgi:hypothetical protein